MRAKLLKQRACVPVQAKPSHDVTCITCRRYTVKFHAKENQPNARYYGTMGVRPCVTAKLHACFEALVLEPHFAQILRRLLATLLPVRSLQGLQGYCACVGQKPASPPCTCHASSGKRKDYWGGPAFGVHFQVNHKPHSN